MSAIILVVGSCLHPKEGYVRVCACFIDTKYVGRLYIILRDYIYVISIFRILY